MMKNGEQSQCRIRLLELNIFSPNLINRYTKNPDNTFPKPALDKPLSLSSPKTFGAPPPPPLHIDFCVFV